MRGRKPKPTVLKLLEGNPGRRPLSADEPTPTAVKAPPKPPRQLGTMGRAVWRTQVADLTSSRVLTISDLLTLEQLCSTAEELAELRVSLKREQRRRGALRDVKLILKLHLAIDRKQNVAVKLESEFGLTPSSRSRVKTERRPVIQDKLKAFQQARRDQQA